MRLIDLDKALAEAEDECRMSDDWKVSHEMMNVFKYQPIIKAIPIEFIKEQIAKTTDINDEDEFDVFYAGHLGYLLNLWEEQNEKDI